MLPFFISVFLNHCLFHEYRCYSLASKTRSNPTHWFRSQRPTFVLQWPLLIEQPWLTPAPPQPNGSFLSNITSASYCPPAWINSKLKTNHPSLSYHCKWFPSTPGWRQGPSPRKNALARASLPPSQEGSRRSTACKGREVSITYKTFGTGWCSHSGRGRSSAKSTPCWP